MPSITPSINLGMRCGSLGTPDSRFHNPTKSKGLNCGMTATAILNHSVIPFREQIYNAGRSSHIVKSVH